jgi:glycerol-3-phosphate acyltransferase PlsX
VRIAVDGMGGDKGPGTVVMGAVDAVNQDSDLTVLLVGNQDILKAELAKLKYNPKQIEVHHAEEEVTMEDHPAVVVRQKRNSSLHVANRLVKSGDAIAVFTAGNTGAAMAVSLLILGRIPGIVRPALLIDFPSNSPSGYTSIIDVGANADCKPKMLAQFAVMGDMYARYIRGVENPRVGLLSLGEEDSKGNELIHETRELMKSLKLNYIGNVEGQDVVNGKAELVVCDGFTGNVILKFGTGLARLIVDAIKHELVNNGWMTKVAAGFMLPVIRKFFRRLDYQETGAAPLLGVAGISTIGHGKSNSKAIKNAIFQAKKFGISHINQHIEEALKQNGVAEL